MKNLFMMIALVFGLFLPAKAQVLESERNDLTGEVIATTLTFNLTGATTLNEVEVVLVAPNVAEARFDRGLASGIFRLERKSDLMVGDFQPHTSGQITSARFVGSVVYWRLDLTKFGPTGYWRVAKLP